jgi:predicted RNase H-like HicB family nuclease
MNRQIELTAVIEKEANLYVALCPELDIASQGESSQEAKFNLIEALELYFETASKDEISYRLHNELEITKVLVDVA